MKSDSEDETYYYRTHHWTDGEYRKRDMGYLIRRKDVADADRIFGYSESELYEGIKAETEKFTASHPGIAVTVRKNGTYSMTYGSGGVSAVDRYKNFLRTVVKDYYRRHMLILKNNKVSLDYRAIQAWQAPGVGAIYKSLSEMSRGNGMNEREFVALLASFVQGLKYRVPPRQRNRENFGFWPPLICLKEKAGDCDSKSTLFATLFYHYKKNSSILVLTKRHAFVGVKGQHKIYPTDHVLTIGGVDYLLIESTGYAKLGWISDREVDYLRNGQYDYVMFN